MARTSRRLSSTARGAAGSDARSDAEPTPPDLARLFAVQRSAGNLVAVRLLARQAVPKPAAPIQADVAAGHILTAAEEKELPEVAEVPELKRELAELDAKVAKDKEEGRAPDPKDEARREEIRRMLRTRVKGDEAETLRINGIAGGPDAWFAEVKTTQFLGRPVTVHKLLADRLKKAEDALKDEAPPPGGWASEAHSGLRPPGQGLHSFGLAIDVNPSRNPWLINPAARGASSYEAPSRSKAIRDAIDRAVLLVCGRTAAEADLQSRPAIDDKDARVEASYDKLDEASRALKRYLELDKPENRSALTDLVGALGAKDPRKRTVDAWAGAIAADRKALTTAAAAKSWSKPEEGFLSLDKRLVTAMTTQSGAGLTWLGDDTIASGRDIMHFDTRGVGPIRRIWSSATGQAVGLGSG